MAPAWLSQLHDLLKTTDGPDLIGRGSRVTVPGDPNRRATVFLPLQVRWAQHRYLAKDAPLFIGKAKVAKGFRLIIADRRKRA